MTALALPLTLVLSLLVAPLAARAQPAGKMHRIGWLSAGAPHADLEIEAFRQG